MSAEQWEAAVAEARATHGPPARAARWAAAAGSTAAQSRLRAHMAHLAACEVYDGLLSFYRAGGAQAIRPFAAALALWQRCEPGKPIMAGEGVLQRLAGFDSAEMNAAVSELRDRLLDAGGKES